MTTMLIISRYCAYDSAPYAGSKTHNYYLKHLIKAFRVKVLTIAHPEDLPKLDFDAYAIDADVVVVNEDPGRAWFFLLFNWRNILNYFGKTMGLVNGYAAHCLIKRARSLGSQGYSPDIILLEWTQTVLMIKDLKKIFPSALYIASEHDVSFLRFKRQYGAASGLSKIKENLRYKSLKKAEISSLRTFLSSTALRPIECMPLPPIIPITAMSHIPLREALSFFSAPWTVKKIIPA